MTCFILPTPVFLYRILPSVELDLFQNLQFKRCYIGFHKQLNIYVVVFSHPGVINN